MSEIIERVARAIHAADEPGELADANEAHRRFCYDAARAAIEAMREPTEAMLIEGCHGSHVTQEDSWRAMIDEALK